MPELPPTAAATAAIRAILTEMEAEGVGRSDRWKFEVRLAQLLERRTNLRELVAFVFEFAREPCTSAESNAAENCVTMSLPDDMSCFRCRAHRLSTKL